MDRGETPTSTQYTVAPVNGTRTQPVLNNVLGRHSGMRRIARGTIKIGHVFARTPHPKSIPAISEARAETVPARSRTSDNKTNRSGIGSNWPCTDATKIESGFN